MKKILVIGDAILDHYICGWVNRQSPEECSAWVLDYEQERFKLGGAANVAANLKSLRSRNEVCLSSIVDETVGEMLKERDIANFSVTTGRPFCIVKTRYVAQSLKFHDKDKQLMRLDNRLRFVDIDVEAFLQYIDLFDYSKFDGVVISDYNKGIIDHRIIRSLEGYDTPVFVDTKKPDLSIWDRVSNCIVKINQTEARKRTSTTKHPLVITSGEDGATLCEKDETTCYPTNPVNNPEVTGAGDAFLAGLVTKYLEEMDLHKAVEYGNVVATESVRHYGTTEVKL